MKLTYSVDGAVHNDIADIVSYNEEEVLNILFTNFLT